MHMKAPNTSEYGTGLGSEKSISMQGQSKKQRKILEGKTYG